METQRTYNWPAIMLLAAIIVVAAGGIYVAHRTLPCLTGEVRTSMTQSADGRTLVATAPVCPEEGQLIFRALALIALTGTVIVAALKVVMDSDAKGDAAVAAAALALGRVPQQMAGRLTSNADIIDAQYRLAQADELRRRADWHDRRDMPEASPDFRGLFDSLAPPPAGRPGNDRVNGAPSNGVQANAMQPFDGNPSANGNGRGEG